LKHSRPSIIIESARVALLVRRSGKFRFAESGVSGTPMSLSPGRSLIALRHLGSAPRAPAREGEIATPRIRSRHTDARVASADAASIAVCLHTDASRRRSRRGIIRVTRRRTISTPGCPTPSDRHRRDSARYAIPNECCAETPRCPQRHGVRRPRGRGAMAVDFMHAKRKVRRI
jgi:hypothetical protein